VNGHICVLGVSKQKSERSYVYVRGINPGKGTVIYVWLGYQTRKVNGNICVLGVSKQESERSYMCVRGIKPGKCTIIYVC